MHSKEYNKDKWLNEALKMEPGYFLPDGFADKIADKVSRKVALRQYLNEFLIYLAVVAGIMILFGAFEIFWIGANWKNWWNFAVNNAIMVGGVNFLLLFVLFTDRVLLRYFMKMKKMDLS